MGGTSQEFTGVFDYKRVLKDGAIDIFMAGRGDMESLTLAPAERGAVLKSHDTNVQQMSRISPTIGAHYALQDELALAFAGVAKAKFTTSKVITYPSRATGLGVQPLMPQFFKWDSTPDATDPCFTGYTINTWRITTTAGTAMYLMGDGTDYYKSRTTANKTSSILIYDGGIVEFGTTPSIDQWRYYNQSENKYGIIVNPGVYDQPIDTERALYWHRHPFGAIIATNDYGQMIKGMPKTTGITELRLFGLIVYEHDFAADVFQAS